MAYRPFSFCFLVFHMLAVAAEESFILIDGFTNATVLQMGPHIEERISPCSTFKIILCLIGYDAGVLIDGFTPTWNFKEGYDDWLPTWRAPQTPKSFMQYSCVWYSKILSLELGLRKIQNYLTAMEYGNQDISGGFAEPGPNDPAWINSSLAISPREQANFIQKMILGKLPLSSNAVKKTRSLLFKGETPEGWRLFGKTGWSGSKDGKALEHGWFVGWIEKNHQFFPFAYLIRERKINLDQRIPRVRQLLNDSGILREQLS